MKFYRLLRFASRLTAVVLLMSLVYPFWVWGQAPIPSTVVRELNTVYDLLAKEKVTEAIAKITSFQEKGGDHYLVSFALGNAYMSAKQYSRARAAYLKAIGKEKDYAPAWFNMAACDIELKLFKTAGDAFIKAYDLSADKKPDALYYASNAYLTADLYQMSLDTFNRLMTHHERDIKLEWKATLVQTLLALKQPRKALPVIEELAFKTKGVQNKQWHEMLLQQYLSLSMHQKALDYAGQLTQENPLEPKWWKGLVHINLVMDNYKAALVALTVYSHLRALSIEEKKLMADLALSVDIPAQSVAILEEVLAIKWELKTLEKLVQGCRMWHQPERALEWVEKGLEKDENNKELLMLKGNLLFSTRAYGEAMSVFDLVTRKDGSTGQAWLMLGYAAWNADKLETARQALEKASKFEAQRKLAIEAMKRITTLKDTLQTPPKG